MGLVRHGKNHQVNRGLAQSPHPTMINLRPLQLHSPNDDLVSKAAPSRRPGSQAKRLEADNRLRILVNKRGGDRLTSSATAR